MAVELQWDKEVAHDSCEVGLGGCSVCWLREVLRRYDVRPSRGVFFAILGYVHQAIRFSVHERWV